MSAGGTNDGCASAWEKGAKALNHWFRCSSELAANCSTQRPRACFLPLCANGPGLTAIVNAKGRAASSSSNSLCLAPFSKEYSCGADSMGGDMTTLPDSSRSTSAASLLHKERLGLLTSISVTAIDLGTSDCPQEVAPTAPRCGQDSCPAVVLPDAWKLSGTSYTHMDLPATLQKAQ
eukprot:CAMPEP_0181412908 /NCGR_PEP_ID=MMETSP1110-20121109/8678_1 /TAXON_ID=174948 /ORGANISM="Symbiodinium sp., Strain CCMP421" /LENGTH=176 /DNA_ID=CAMNT_0023535663 /DNA_START=57 /DNA_END=588 /DNA_ORIENTATION=-